MSTSYHAKYYAYELTKQAGYQTVDRISMSLFDSSVDLNPHQVEAALFAFQSPLTKGVVLADEVGLGKTIEAGLVSCQYWPKGNGICLSFAQHPSENSGRKNYPKNSTFRV